VNVLHTTHIRAATSRHKESLRQAPPKVGRAKPLAVRSPPPPKKKRQKIPVAEARRRRKSPNRSPPQRKPRAAAPRTTAAPLRQLRTQLLLPPSKPGASPPESKPEAKKKSPIQPDTKPQAKPAPESKPPSKPSPPERKPESKAAPPPRDKLTRQSAQFLAPTGAACRKVLEPNGQSAPPFVRAQPLRILDRHCPFPALRSTSTRRRPAATDEASATSVRKQGRRVPCQREKACAPCPPTMEANSDQPQDDATFRERFWPLVIVPPCFTETRSFRRWKTMITQLGLKPPGT